jgi:peptide/nickel transport system permease protein
LPVTAICPPLHLDLGRSYQQRRPVVAILAERLPRTLFLALTAVTLQSLLGVALGVYAARHKRKLRDRATVCHANTGLPVTATELARLTNPKD